MSTPSYLGPNQPTSNAGGWLSRLGSYFGSGGTPAYGAAGQPGTSNAIGSSNAPSYAPAVVRTGSGTSTAIDRFEHYMHLHGGRRTGSERVPDRSSRTRGGTDRDRDPSPGDVIAKT
jgi:hypothetical protein